MLPSILTAAGGGGRARQRRCTLRRVPRVDAPRRQRRCGVHTRPLLCHGMPLANYLPVAHTGARGPTGFTERTRAGFEPHGVCGACGPVPADRGRRARGAAQRGAASLRRLAQARADLQGSSTPPLAAHLCSMKARAIIWPLPVWRSYFRGMIRSKWCVVPFTRRCFDAYSVLRAEGSSSFASESDPRTVALTDGRRWRQTTWLSWTSSWR